MSSSVLLPTFSMLYISISLLSLISVVLCAQWEVPVELSLGERPFEPLGRISFVPTDDGNYTGIFAASPSMTASRVFSHILHDPEAPYRVRTGDVFSTSEAWLFALSGLRHEFSVTIDPAHQKLLSLVAFPAQVYDVDKQYNVDELKQNEPHKISGNVVVLSQRKLQGPDVTSYLQRMEEEKRARQHGANQDNRSFLAKYWMYIVPAVIFFLITNAVGADQQGE